MSSMELLGKLLIKKAECTIGDYKSVAENSTVKYYYKNELIEKPFYIEVDTNIRPNLNICGFPIVSKKIIDNPCDNNRGL